MICNLVQHIARCPEQNSLKSHFLSHQKESSRLLFVLEYQVKKLITSGNQVGIPRKKNTKNGFPRGVGFSKVQGGVFKGKVRI